MSSWGALQVVLMLCPEPKLQSKRFPPCICCSILSTFCSQLQLLPMTGSIGSELHLQQLVVPPLAALMVILSLAGEIRAERRFLHRPAPDDVMSLSSFAQACASYIRSMRCGCCRPLQLSTPALAWHLLVAGGVLWRILAVPSMSWLQLQVWASS